MGVVFEGFGCGLARGCLWFLRGILEGRRFCGLFLGAVLCVWLVFEGVRCFKMFVPCVWLGCFFWGVYIALKCVVFLWCGFSVVVWAFCGVVLRFVVDARGAFGGLLQTKKPFR